MRRLAVIGAAAAVVLLGGAHLFALGLAARHLALPIVLTVGLGALAVVKHLGLLAPLGVWLRGRRDGAR